VEEIKWQNKNSERTLSLFLYDFLLELKDLKADVPGNAIKQIRTINKDEKKITHKNRAISLRKNKERSEKRQKT